MPTAHVRLPDASYAVHVRGGVLREAGAILSSLMNPRRVAIVTDRVVAKLHLESLRASLADASIDSIVSIIEPGEEHKTVATVSQIYDQFLPARVERSTPVLALGGGIVGDVAGFVAATILRGVPFVQIPTTLLAMVDASVGGKTGVNHAAGKNLIGAFLQPRAVIADVETLRTLPRRELIAGLAECIKHQLIADAAGFAEMERSVDRVASVEVSLLEQLVTQNVQIKARFVEADPFERGIRAHLNFGHTFGHAIENVLHYRLLHGECVGLGMIAASWMSMKLGMIDEASFKRIVSTIERAGLPTKGVDASVDQLLDAMRSDKKVRASKIRFVLLDRIGHAVVRDDVDDSLVKQALEVIR